jgi:hypothetical protein
MDVCSISRCEYARPHVTCVCVHTHPRMRTHAYGRCAGWSEAQVQDHDAQDPLVQELRNQRNQAMFMSRMHQARAERCMCVCLCVCVCVCVCMRIARVIAFEVALPLSLIHSFCSSVSVFTHVCTDRDHIPLSVTVRNQAVLDKKIPPKHFPPIAGARH